MAVALCALVVAGCAGPKESVVLLPSASTQDAAVVVTQGSKQVVLAEPYAAARASRDGPEPFRTNAAEVQARYGSALAAQPLRPAQFTLYFVEGKEEFTDESKAMVNTVFAEIASRPVPDIVVVGHTDSTGTDQVNDALAQRRADSVKAQLVQRGVAAANVEAISRGKRDPAVATASGVSEARNRRVEIIVR